MPRFRHAFPQSRLPVHHALGESANPGTLQELADFGSNPGQLRAEIFVPDALRADGALVVVLHGCTQTAASYDLGSGWSTLAREQGFALLFPEQQRSNNANLCFNWFERGDIERDGGEAASIAQMIATMIERYDLDPARVFVTGLSAGGAMTAVMLATYPDVFEGGAIIAGLPYGCATTIPEALATMRCGDRASLTDLALRVARASRHTGKRPSVAIWHGTADPTVSPANAAALVNQWHAVLDLPEMPASSEAVKGHRRTVWKDEAGREMLQYWEVLGMGHGTPVTVSGPDACGRAQPHMLEAGISSTREIARSWGLCPSAARIDVSGNHRDDGIASPSERLPVNPALRSPPTGVGRVIEDALRAAGLMR